MASSIVPVSIVAPGFYGLNLQDSPVDLDQKYALEMTNCVIDKSGRVGARKGWAKSHATLAAAGSSDFQCIHESITTTGTSTIVGAANGKLFKLSSGTLSELTYGGGGVAPTISDNNWQAVSINGAVIFFQEEAPELPALHTNTIPLSAIFDAWRDISAWCPSRSRYL